MNVGIFPWVCLRQGRCAYDLLSGVPSHNTVHLRTYAFIMAAYTSPFSRVIHSGSIPNLITPARLSKDGWTRIANVVFRSLFNVTVHPIK